MDNFEEEFVKCSSLHLECELFDKNVNKGASSLEMKDRSCRPAMSEKPDVSGYDEILVSFPIWWYRERSIIDSFMESADFSGKTAVPYCTSGGSGLGDSTKNMQALAPGAKVLDGKRFSASASPDELKKWAEQF